MIVNLRNIFNHPWSVSMAIYQIQWKPILFTIHVNKKNKKYNCSLNCICSWSWSLLTKFDYDSLFFFKIEDEKKISTTDNCQRNAEVRLFGEKIANYMKLFDKKN